MERPHVQTPMRVSPQALSERPKVALSTLVRLRRLTLAVTFISALILAILQWTVGVNNLSGALEIVFWIVGPLAAMGLVSLKIFAAIPSERT